MCDCEWPLLAPLRAISMDETSEQKIITEWFWLGRLYEKINAPVDMLFFSIQQKWTQTSSLRVYHFTKIDIYDVLLMI